MAARVTHAGRSARSGCSRRRYRVSPTSFLCSRKNATRLTMIRHRSSSSLMLKATFRPHDSRSEDSRPPTFEIGVHSRLTSCSRNGRSGGISRQAEKPLDSRLHRRGSSHGRGRHAGTLQPARRSERGGRAHLPPVRRRAAAAAASCRWRACGSTRRRVRGSREGPDRSCRGRRVPCRRRAVRARGGTRTAGVLRRCLGAGTRGPADPC